MARAYFLKARPSLLLRLEGKLDHKKTGKTVITRLETVSFEVHNLLCGLVVDDVRVVLLGLGCQPI